MQKAFTEPRYFGFVHNSFTGAKVCTSLLAPRVRLTLHLKASNPADLSISLKYQAFGAYDTFLTYCTRPSADTAHNRTSHRCWSHRKTLSILIAGQSLCRLYYESKVTYCRALAKNGSIIHSTTTKKSSDCQCMLRRETQSKLCREKTRERLERSSR